MVIKSLSRKSPSFGQLIRYIDASPEKGSPIRHNLFGEEGEDPKALEQAFQANARLLPPRRNGVQLYHEILSFHAEDRKHLSPELLEDLARRWMELRAPEALGYARVHYEREHVHIHCLLSSNGLGTRRRIRHSKARFQSLQRELEAYQIERYPELIHSRQQQRNSPDHRRRRRERIRDQVAHCLEWAVDEPDLLRRLEACGLIPYTRGKESGGVEPVAGRPLSGSLDPLTGVVENGRKFRLSGLGLVDAYQGAREAWKRRRGQIRASLEALRLRGLQRRLRGDGFAERALAVIEGKAGPEEGRETRRAGRSIRGPLAGLRRIGSRKKGRGGRDRMR